MSASVGNYKKAIANPVFDIAWFLRSIFWVYGFVLKFSKEVLSIAKFFTQLIDRRGVLISLVSSGLKNNLVEFIQSSSGLFLQILGLFYFHGSGLL